LSPSMAASVTSCSTSSSFHAWPKPGS
jgi:hypothetical protein